MTPAALAIIGLACRYPDADSPAALWENVLAKRQAFRRIPAERLNLDDYFAADPRVPDSTYATEAALLTDYVFDRVRYRIAKTTYESADLAHWLALDIAAQALADAGFSEGAGLPRETTGVVLGNTLTGEFSRANGLRLRWPYVRRVLNDALDEQGWDVTERREFLARVETSYKAPFPAVGEETLAGGLSNTIAGRICNYFDLHGGGYTVDGACASSLLAIANACSALASGELDVAIAGGVDLSLDPFELIGFAKTGALAPETMRVYDRRSAGFWPGEGCGFVVLMREADAAAQQRRVYATVCGWGVSSDGSGGITRPEVGGQQLALQRAYRRAGFGPESVAYFEGHGTGTSVGDTTELAALSRARAAAPAPPPAVISSIKTNIGHTKAAAGVAGFIKATLALQTQLLPPTAGCEQPHAALQAADASLRVLDSAQLWPSEQPLRAGVSAMGFGGINSHIVLEGRPQTRRRTLSSREQQAVGTPQDVELFLLGAESATLLLRQVNQLLSRAPNLSRAELTDLAVYLAARLDRPRLRAAVLAATPRELADRLATLNDWLADGETNRLDVDGGVFLGDGRAPRIGFLFPGQGSPAHGDSGALQRRYEAARRVFDAANLARPADTTETAYAQPAIVAASVAAMRVLDQLGVRAQLAIGHSLGELTALHWAGALSEAALLRLATVRGRAMSELGNPPGAMASIAANAAEVGVLLNGDQLVIAGINSARQTVVSGDAHALEHFLRKAEASGLHATRLPVSHAFHSPLVAAAVQPVAEHLSRAPLDAVRATVISTVTGDVLTPDCDLAELLCTQITAPVRWLEALGTAAAGADLLIEVGPGHVLSRLSDESTELPVVAVDAGGPSLAGLLRAFGAAFALGAPVDHRELYAGRFARPFDLDRAPRFLANPCETAPSMPAPAIESSVDVEREDAVTADRPHGGTTLEIVRRLIAERAELPLEAVYDNSHLLRDLHLNSITVSQLVVAAAKQLGLARPAAPTDYASSSVAEVAAALDEQLRTVDRDAEPDERQPAGIDSWIRSFSVEWIERPAPAWGAGDGAGDWRVHAPADYPHAAALRAALERAGGAGTVVCLPQDCGAEHLAALLPAARDALAREQPWRFVLLQHGGGAAAFARTLHLEARALTTCVLDLPLELPSLPEIVAREALGASDYLEVRYSATGTRCEPVLRVLPDTAPDIGFPLDADDVLLVTGGGKGITAECALALARESGARLALLGRSDPASDSALATNLERVGAAGVRYIYLSVDVTDRAAVHTAVRTVEAELGPVRGVLHGAARNVPQLIAQLDEATLRATLAPKVDGLQHILGAIEPDKLKLLVGFSSIIGRMGLRGEADYAVANEWLTRDIERWQQAHPACRCLSLEWSIWSEIGMGARLGGTDMLLRAGITPIPPDSGIQQLKQLLSRRLANVATVVSGRFGEPPTLRVERPDLPLLRFLEQVRAFYPGVELIVDCALSALTDPYVDDHAFGGARLLPGVLGLEAMAQAATAVTGIVSTPRFEQVRFLQPVVVPEQGTAHIRLVALVRAPGRVELALRCAETGFKVDHFRATCHFTQHDTALEAMPELAEHMLPPVTLDPQSELYGKQLFQRGRFQRLSHYDQLSATSCTAHITTGDGRGWFGRYLPSTMLLGDPGSRDAAIHAIQACVPHVALLPVGVDQICFAASAAAGPWRMQARERSRAGDVFSYDLVIVAGDGSMREQWRGLKLRIINGTEWREPWAPALLGPYVERRVAELVPGSDARVAVARNVALVRQASSSQALWQALEHVSTIRRRPDGKPESIDRRLVSTAHAGALTLAVAGTRTIACDLEAVASRTDDTWSDLLGPDGCSLVDQTRRRSGEAYDMVATRVWAATECLRKAGAAVDQSLVLESTAASWIVFAAGRLRIATARAALSEHESELVLAVLVEARDAAV